MAAYWEIAAHSAYEYKNLIVNLVLWSRNFFLIVPFHGHCLLVPFSMKLFLTRYRRISYNLNVMRQPACLVFNPIMADNYAAVFNCTPVGRAADIMMAPT